MITPERSFVWPGCRSGSCLWPALTIPARLGGLPTASWIISCSGRRAWMSCRIGRIPWPSTSVRSWSLSRNDPAGRIDQLPLEDDLRHSPVCASIVGEPKCRPSGGKFGISLSQWQSSPPDSESQDLMSGQSQTRASG